MTAVDISEDTIQHNNLRIQVLNNRTSYVQQPRLWRKRFNSFHIDPNMNCWAQPRVACSVILSWPQSFCGVSQEVSNEREAPHGAQRHASSFLNTLATGGAGSWGSMTKLGRWEWTIWKTEFLTMFTAIKPSSYCQGRVPGSINLIALSIQMTQLLWDLKAYLRA